MAELVARAQISEAAIRSFARAPLSVPRPVGEAIAAALDLDYPFSGGDAANPIFATPTLFRHRLKLDAEADWFVSEHDLLPTLGRFDPFSHIEAGSVPGAVLTYESAVVPLSGLLFCEWSGNDEAKSTAEKLAIKLVRARRRARLPSVLANRR